MSGSKSMKMVMLMDNGLFKDSLQMVDVLTLPSLLILHLATTYSVENYLHFMVPTRSMAFNPT